jgi:hypothetical protein
MTPERPDPWRQIRSQLIAERDQSWREHWRDLAEHILPRRSRFLEDRSKRGEKKHGKIINGTATRAARTLASGMMSGITSPARPWFQLSTPDVSLAEHGPVKAWLHQVTERMMAVFRASNIYNGLHVLYEDLAVFNTASLMVLEDDEDVLRCYHQPIGSYAIGQSSSQRVDSIVRDFAMTVRQLVNEFGVDHVSESVKRLYESGQGEQPIDICHVIAPNGDFDPRKPIRNKKRWRSVYFEVAAESGTTLRDSGFDEFPALCPRWLVSGEDSYGEGPGMDALADIRQLQLMERKKLHAIEMKVTPPVVAPSDLRGSAISMLPGGITYADARTAEQAIRPLYQVDFDVSHLAHEIARAERRIDQVFYVDLFLMLAGTDGRDMTAREVVERHEEKMLMLGPVIERLSDELLDPLIDRAFAIMMRRGLIPPPPRELEGENLQVNYISILAQAQRMVATAGVERVTSFVGNLAAVDQTVLDKVDLDETVDAYSHMVGVPPEMIRSDDDVAEIRAARAAAMQQQQQAEAAMAAAQGAETLSRADMRGDNALTRLIGAGTP